MEITIQVNGKTVTKTKDPDASLHPEGHAAFGQRKIVRIIRIPTLINFVTA